MSGRAHETRVLVLCDRKAADEKLAHEDPVNGPLVLVRVGRSHQEVAGRNPGEARRVSSHQKDASIVQVSRALFAPVSSTRRADARKTARVARYEARAVCDGAHAIH